MDLKLPKLDKKQNLEYWKLPDVIQEDINREQVPFLKAYRTKIESIQYAYSKPISDKQITFLQKDESLIAETETFINHLGEKIDFLLREHDTLNQMLAGQVEQNQELLNQVIDLTEKNARLRLQYKTF